ncbi:MAG: DUF3489 domain-containing protein [Proteobacteria bacterium]|nr:MAG: DUF3489 domain-containing protein [Pseudomonadota bacterium]
MPRKAKPAHGTVTAASIAPPNKTNLVLELMRREEGATLEELTSATNWQPHSTRAALTGLRKKGHNIVRDKRGDVSCYRIMAVA